MSLGAGTSYRHAHHLLAPSVAAYIFARSTRTCTAAQASLFLDKPHTIPRYTLSREALEDGSPLLRALLETLRCSISRSRRCLSCTSETYGCDAGQYGRSEGGSLHDELPNQWLDEPSKVIGLTGVPNERSLAQALTTS